MVTNSNQLAVRRTASDLPALRLNKVEFLEQLQPVAVTKMLGTLNTPVKCAIATAIPTLAEIENTYDEEFLLGYIKLWIINLGDFFGTKFSDEQLLDTAILCIQGRKFFNLADIAMAFTDMKHDIRSTLTCQKILEGFEKYSTIRATDYYERELNSCPASKRGDETPTQEQVYKWYKERREQQEILHQQEELVALNKQYSLKDILKICNQESLLSGEIRKAIDDIKTKTEELDKRASAIVEAELQLRLREERLDNK